MKYNNNFKSLIVIILIMSTIIFSGCGILPEESEVETSKLISQMGVDYQFGRVKRGNLTSSIKGKAYIISPKYYNYSYEYSGWVVKNVYVKKGDMVKKGDVLLKFDNDELSNKIKEQEISLEIARLEYESIKNKGNDSDIKKSLLQLEREKNKLDFLKSEMKKSIIISPMDGIIIYSLNPEKGEISKAGQIVFRISDPSQIGMVFESMYGAYIPKDEKIEFLYGNNKYIGKTGGDYSDDKISLGTWINLNVIPNDVQLGDSIDIELNLIYRSDILMVPIEGIRVKEGKHYVIMIEEGKRALRYVETGAESIDSVEIIKGLKEGEEIVLN